MERKALSTIKSDGRTDGWTMESVEVAFRLQGVQYSLPDRLIQNLSADQTKIKGHPVQ